jgi:hypothetical protein
VFQEEFLDKYGRKTAQFSAILLTKNDQKKQTLKAFITVHGPGVRDWETQHCALCPFCARRGGFKA